MKKILISTLFVCVFMFTITLNATAEEITPAINSIDSTAVTTKKTIAADTTVAPKKTIAPKKIELKCVKTAV